MHRRYGHACALILTVSVFALSSCSLSQVLNPPTEISRSQLPVEPVYIQQQRGTAIYYPKGAQPVMSAQSQGVSIQGGGDTRLAYTQSAGESLGMQVQSSLAEAEALVASGETRMQEGNVREAVLEFERARILIEQELDPALAQIQSQSQIQGGVSILSTSQIQGVSGERTELVGRINEAYDARGAGDMQQELDKVSKLREETRYQLTPISVAPSSNSINSRLIPVTRPSQPQQITPTSPTDQSWNWQDEFSGEVERNIRIFQQRQADFERCLQRANQYFPQVASILRSYGVPPEIGYIALIESGFQPNAASSSGRAGLWQLSVAQARQYGLSTSAGRDQRFSIEASTYAFARYISSLYQRAGTWRLAVISHSPQQDYLAKLIAAMAIAGDPQAYGFNVYTPNLSGYTDTSWTQGWSGGQSSQFPAVQSHQPEMLEPPSATLY
ncbi:transglycosylase SLT domain-containing protein [Candidatus Moduliflexus flocculans]|uniref:Transglycosylase SLT domain-containing protein n=1 Tax=Candidatus Moduliflexus flocculans TaxID=1499966 RepID=A0A0S6VVC7_9BACT|nr:transglycosylase SLT domain-containing protein [Candidatus Moduliflexus flocculans]